MASGWALFLYQGGYPGTLNLTKILQRTHPPPPENSILIIN
eukprot:COSAG01_NODE_48929_length_376_cov_3.718412_1_plen_40_part_10